MAQEAGYIAETPALLARLRRIEGQVRGLQRLVEEERHCVDILTQISAATKALEGVALMLLDEHLRHCLAQADDPDDMEARLDEASRAIRRLVRSRARTLHTHQHQ